MGAGLALSRFKRERAFDRRLEWYQRACSKLNEISTTIISTANAADSAGARISDEAWGSLREFYRSIALPIAEGSIYAKQDGYDALQALARNVHSYTTSDPKPSGGDFTTARRSIARTIAREAWNASDVLAREIRTELKWSRLKK
jgi:hypothetical protein